MSKHPAEVCTLLTFRLQSEVYGVEITKVHEIVEYDRTITRVPTTPEFMEGVMNLRGLVVPVVDMNSKLGFGHTTVTPDTSLIIIEIQCEGEPLILGAVADEVEDILEIGFDDILLPPSAGTLLKPEFLIGLARRGDGFVMIMDIDVVLSPEELVELSQPLDFSPGPS